MKKTALITAALLFCFCGGAAAHSPSGIAVKVSGTNVSVTVRHGVSDPQTHYVKAIRIMVNGELADERVFSSQIDNDTQAASFDIPVLKKGDVIAVEAACDQSGKLQKEFPVGNS